MMGTNARLAICAMAMVFAKQMRWLPVILRLVLSAISSQEPVFH